MSRVKSTGNILSRLLSEQAYLKYPRLHPRLSYELVFHLKLFFFPSSTPHFAIGHVVEFRVTIPEHSYLPAAGRTEPPLCVQSRIKCALCSSRAAPICPVSIRKKKSDLKAFNHLYAIIFIF